jgi:hypothetical protein
MALLLLHQLPRHGRLLSTGTAAAEGAALCSVYCKSQINAGCFIYHICCMLERQLLSTAAAAQAVSLLCEPAVAELLLQLLTVYTMLLHQQHSEQQQASQPSKQHRADLLPIPAFHQHQDMLQLLPGGQAYLDAAGKAAAASCEPVLAGAPDVGFRAYMYGVALDISLHQSCVPQQSTLAVHRDAPVLLAAAVRLVLELQLLAAAAVQRQQQQQHDTMLDSPDEAPVYLLQVSNSLLHNQIKAILQAGDSCLPPEVLQQAGLQLLQALAAPLQQLQLTECNDPWWDAAVQAAAAHQFGSFSQQLLALGAAAPGLTAPQLVAATSGKGLSHVQGTPAAVCQPVARC